MSGAADVSRKLFAALVAVLALVAASLTGAGAARAAADPPTPSVDGVGSDGRDALLDLPLYFVENRGQVSPEVHYQAQTSDHTFFFTPDRIVMALGAESDTRFGLGLRFVDANPDVRPRGVGPTGSSVNYLRGDDPAGWQTGLPGSSGIVYPDLWPGIDMTLRGDDGLLKYEFLVRPGARPSDIRLGYDGAEGVTLDGSGGLLIDTAAGQLSDSAPVSWQDVDGARVPVDSRYDVQEASTEYGFAVGDYAADHELVIDPALEYSTLLGGASDDSASDLAVDGNGNVVVVGRTQSTDFPTTAGAIGGTFRGGIMDGFVAKVNADGSGLVYATYLGGTPTATRRENVDNTELARSVALDGSGNAYVTGQTSSGDFPTTSGAFDTSLGVGEQTATDAFVTKLGPTGALVYSTFLGGAAGSDDGRAIAVDGSGSAYVGGSTFSSDFPTTEGAFDTAHNGGEDVFVAKLNATGSALAYSTILGGADNELSHGVAVDDAGNAYVTGSTRSVDFPATPGSFQPAHSGGAFAELFEGFVTKVNADGSALVYGTFLGGTEIDHATALAVDSAGSAYVLAGTQSPTFPTTPGAYDTEFTGTSEGAVVKLDAAGSDLVYSTFFQGAGSIRVDGAGNAWLAGGADGTAPITAGGQASCGGRDVYVAQLNAAGSGINFATYYGGTQNEGASGIDLDGSGNVYVAGSTLSADFPTTLGAFDRTWAGDTSTFWGDAFVLKFAAGDAPVAGPGCPAPVLSSVSLDPASVAGGESSTGTVTLGAAAPAGGASVALASGNTAAATVPASVTVPEGATSATFTVSTSSVSSDTSVTISATQGEVTRTATLTVTAPAPTVSVSTLQLDPTTVTGGQSSTGTVTLTGAAPPGGSAVEVFSSNTDVATVPPTVTVPEGGTSATFTVSTLQQDSDQSSAISARYGGVTRSQILSVTAGSSTTTSTFSGRADRNQTTVHTLSVGTGTVSVNLNWDESRSDLDLRVRTSSGTVVFSDTGGARPKTGSFQVTAGEHRFEVMNSTRRGTDYTLSVTHPVVSSTPPPGDTTAPTVNISSPAAGSTVSGTVTVGASASDDVGVTEVRFFVDDTPIGSDTTEPYTASWDTTTVADGSRVLTARALDAAANATTSESVTVTVSNTASEPEPTVSVSSLGLNPTSVTGGDSSTGTVTLTAAAPAGGAAVSLASDSTAATVPASVTVPAGATSATFTVGTNEVSSSTSATISATFGGSTRTAVLTVGSATQPSPSLDAPTLLSPADEARWEPGVSQTFDWTDVSGAATYTLQVSTSSAFTSIQLERGVTASQVSLSFSSEGTRYWRVRANDGAGDPGAWSGTRSFRIKD